MPILHSHSSSDFSLEFQEPDFPELLVRSWEAVEKISAPYRVVLQLVSTQRDIELADVLSQQVRLKINGAVEDRYIHGVVSRFSQSNSSSDFARYEMEMVPGLAFLAQHKEFRIFQQMSAKDIVTDVLAAFGISGDPWIKWNLNPEPAVREYCVCYGESLLSFIHRLLAEEGIFYYFEHFANSHLLVLANQVAAHEEIAGGAAVAYRADKSRLGDGEYVFEFGMKVQVRPQKTLLRDFFFTAPLDEVEEEVTDSGGFDLVGHPAATGISVYNYPADFTADGDAAKVAQLRHAQNQANLRLGQGTSNCRRLIPGTKFTLEDHERDSFNAEYTLTQVHHVGNQPGVTSSESSGAPEVPDYEVQFKCLLGTDTWQWAKMPKKPRVYGVQTALVVGVQGEDIYTDEDGYGQVKVQFHWDRRGEFNEESSCWLRVAQPTAGPGMGQFALPRVGHEVVVSFLNGDPDRPLITGVLYNAENMPPLSLPAEKSRSTIKTLSTPDGEGFNELRFEDKKGEEQIFIHAQMDLDRRVLNDVREYVGNDKHALVINDQVEEVQNDVHLVVGRHRTTKLTKDENRQVGGKEAVHITDSYSLSVDGEVIEVFGDNHSEECSGDMYLKASNIVIEAETQLTLVCGGSEVVLSSSGVTIKGSEVVLDSSSVGIAGGAGTSAGSGTAGSAVEPAEPIAPVEAAENTAGLVAPIKEQTFKEPDLEEIEAEELVWIEIELIGEDDVGIPGEAFLIKTPDNKVIRGTTGPDGIAKVIGLEPGTCKVSFPNLDEEAWEPV